MLRSMSYGSLCSKMYCNSYRFLQETSRRRGSCHQIHALHQHRKTSSTLHPRLSLRRPVATALLPRLEQREMENAVIHRTTAARACYRQYGQECSHRDTEEKHRPAATRRDNLTGGRPLPNGCFGSLRPTFVPTTSFVFGSPLTRVRCFSSFTSVSTNPFFDLYMWGTDTKGSLLKPPDRREEKVVDVPQLIQEVPWKAGSSNNNSQEEAGGGLARVVCGATDTALVLNNGQCYLLGENKYGQLGFGHKDPVATPALVTLPPSSSSTVVTAEEADATSCYSKITDVALGSSFAAVVDADGFLYTSGFGGSVVSGMGMLGHGNAESLMSFTLVQSLVEDECRVKQVQVGESHMTVLTTEGEVLTCGAGSYGRLGNFDTVDQLYLEPVEVLTPDHRVIQIASGKSFTLALTLDGTVYGWGRNHRGQLGVGLGLAVDMYAMQNIPEPLDSSDELANRRVVKVAAGSSHAACIVAGGELFYWGMGLHLEPVRVDALLHTKIVDVACGREYTVAIDEEGRAYSWGKGGKTGCLGQGGAVKQLHRPERMEAFDDQKRVVQVSAGWSHAAACVVAPPTVGDDDKKQDE